MPIADADFISDVLISVHANVRELQERKSVADPAKLHPIEGKLIAYHEVLSVLPHNASEYRPPSSEFGL